MIYLAKSRTNIPVIAEQWKTLLYKFLFKKHKRRLRLMYENKCIRRCPTYYDRMRASLYYIFKPQLKSTEYQRLKNLLDYRYSLPTIILADEKKMADLVHEVENMSEEVKYVLKELFVKLYKDFTQSKMSNDMTIAHHFFYELNIRTCPYCNRQYTFTIDKIHTQTAPEYDHFYDKAHYPLLAVSFYNLIPSCHTCNHIKGTKTAYVNPYFRGFESCFRLVDDDGKELNKAEILKQSDGKLAFLKSNGKVSCYDQQNIKTFGLQELYSKHDDYINSIIEKVVAYNNTTQQALVDAFQSASYSPQQVFDFVWGKYLEISQFENQPLSKLTKDILEQLDIQR